MSKNEEIIILESYDSVSLIHTVNGKEVYQTYINQEDSQGELLSEFIAHLGYIVNVEENW